MKRMIRILALMAMVSVYATVDAQIVFTKFKEKDAPESNLSRVSVYQKGITAAYTITSEKK